MSFLFRSRLRVTTSSDRSNRIQVVIPQEKKRKYGGPFDDTPRSPPKISAVIPTGAVTRTTSHNHPSLVRRYIAFKASEAKYHQRYRYRHSSRTRSTTPCCRGSISQRSALTLSAGNALS